ncbi:hypothetical protein FsymDg_4046 [Candidatus Protofrankia datiscae]|uniref:Uncharacterized protein n=1 Tax=Candidatus Protofrankia datiscae TaxID=2716812 RepID=F8AVK5_9ACTN|nr:hypothetical protein FsymDg_4046 [Candidatus Protofrankia datiscae]
MGSGFMIVVTWMLSQQHQNHNDHSGNHDVAKSRRLAEMPVGVCGQRGEAAWQKQPATRKQRGAGEAARINAGGVSQRRRWAASVAQ